jgi:hypothetical protein
MNGVRIGEMGSFAMDQPGDFQLVNWLINAANGCSTRIAPLGKILARHGSKTI